MLYADIILPFPLGDYFTYGIPENIENSVAVGKRVLVPFGAKHFYTGLVRKIHSNKPQNYEVKNILLVLDNKPIFDDNHLRLQDWIMSYYMSSPGDVFKASVPSGMRLESHTNIFLKNENFSSLGLNDKELIICNKLLNASNVSINDVNEYVDLKNAMPYVQSLMHKGIVDIEEKVSARYKEKKNKYVRLCANLSECEISAFMDSLSRAKAQQKVLLTYLNLSQRFISSQENIVLQSELLKISSSTSSALKALCDKNILEVYTETVSRLDNFKGEVKPLHILSPDQHNAYDEIEQAFKEKDSVLLHGVTSSGKTEVYTHLINKCIKEGKQVLYLLPEISLTTQITQRLQSFFGDELAVYHSKFSNNERVEIWNRLKSDNPYKLVLGVRSSLFLPFNNLGLIIIDEEHEASFKQQNPAPRYNARDAALVLANIYGAKCLLGSATPSIESAFNAHKKKYGYVKLDKRYSGIQMPEILISDLARARFTKSMKGVLAPALFSEITKALHNGKQVILFQNRRGYASYVQCYQCAQVVKCKFCDVSLTYHKYDNKLICHHCGFSQDMLHTCPSCDTQNLAIKGFGTERIEEDLAKYFPDYKVSRMDLDTASTKRKLDSIIERFQDKKIDILVGTQMLTKGLDFDNLALVGVLDADSLLNFPDFRSYERAYQLLAQVSGRAGRRGERGKVIIQTSQVDNPILKYVIDNDYSALYKSQIKERKEFIYPPFYKMIEINMKHIDPRLLNHFSFELAMRLRKIFGIRVFGPHEPLISKVYKSYIRTILLKIETKSSLFKAKTILHKETKDILSEKRFSKIILTFDVDPM
ncbi:MAG: primosomal protein N' [Marinifilaceae bacterium]